METLEKEVATLLPQQAPLNLQMFPACEEEFGEGEDRMMGAKSMQPLGNVYWNIYFKVIAEKWHLGGS